MAPESASTRTATVGRVLAAVLLLNLAIAAIKFIVGITSGALSVVADAFHSLVDASSNLIGLVGVWVAARPADANHPYGHHKYETITAMAIGAMLLVAAFEIGQATVRRLVRGQPSLDVTPATIGLLALTLAINLAVTLQEARAGRRLRSSVLLADAQHTRVDLFVTASVIASLVGARLGLAWLDPVVAGAVALLLLRAAFTILRSTSAVLTDVAAADPERIQRIARDIPGVTQVYRVRSRGRSDAVYVDLHVGVSPAMGTDQAHGVASAVEQRINEALPEVVDTVVHVEPAWAMPPSPWEELSLKLRRLADGLGLGLHDLHAHLERDGRYSVEVHLELDAGLSLSQAHALADEFERRARALMPNMRARATHLEPLAPELPGEQGRLSPQRRAEFRQRLVGLADHLAGPGACHSVELHNVNGHLTATLHVTQPADQPLPQAHALAEAIERQLQAEEPRLGRVVVHVEPPGASDESAGLQTAE